MGKKTTGLSYRQSPHRQEGREQSAPPAGTTGRTLFPPAPAAEEGGEGRRETSDLGYTPPARKHTFDYSVITSFGYVKDGGGGTEIERRRGPPPPPHLYARSACAALLDLRVHHATPARRPANRIVPTPVSTAAKPAPVPPVKGREETVLPDT